MKKTLKPFLLACCAAFVLTACQKATSEAPAEAPISDAVIGQINALGFNTTGVQKIDEGFLVEGDIVLTEADLAGAAPTSPEMIVANEEHYRTNNLVNATTYSTIRVRIASSSSSHNAVFTAALDEAIRRYNNENLRIQFQRVSSGANIVIDAYYAQNNTLGSAGFPSGGAPYGTIRMNTYHYSTSTGSGNVNYIGTIMAHEMGHCIGFRHTDYMNRAYSCGGAYYNEGASTVGAVHIPGTPTGPSSGSWMLACSNGGNRPFTSYDRTALAYVY